MHDLWRMMTDDPGDTYRNFNAVLCLLVFAGLMWRLIGRWDLSFPLARIIVGLFAALYFFLALATARRAYLGGEFNEIQYAITVHAIVTLVVVALWPRILGMGKGPGPDGAVGPGPLNGLY